MALSIDDFITPCFDKQTPVRRRLPAREQGEWTEEEEEQFGFDGTQPEHKEFAIEGVTYTDNFKMVGYTYFEKDGMLWLNYWDEENKKNVRLFEKPIATAEEFEKYIKKADKKITKYETAKRSK